MFEKIEKMMNDRNLHFTSPKLSIEATASIFRKNSWMNGN